jgi:hypothetical protein
LALLPSPPPEESFAAEFPNLAREWNEKNLPLTPDMFRPSGQKKVWWVCPEGHHDYRSTLAHRGRGCPKCARLENIKAIQRAAIRRSGSVADDATLASFWHSTLNLPLLPEELSRGSKLIVWWFGTCGHEWKRAVHDQVRRHSCPICSRKHVGETIAEAAIRRSGSLVENYPDVASQWHPTKNGELLPSGVSGFSNLKVWWPCPNGHEYVRCIADQTRGSGRCTICSREEKRGRT